MLSVVIKAIGLKPANGTSDEIAIDNMQVEQINTAPKNVNDSEETDIAESMLKGSSETLISVNINAADKDELCSLPGIGEATAKKILDYRNTAGKFTDIDDLLKVNGIGIKKFEKLKDMITTGEVNGKTETE